MTSFLNEGLLEPSTVRLFGRIFNGLKVGDLGTNPSGNSPLITRLRAEPDKVNLARIYGFSYLGNYFKLPDPPVMLVFTDGEPVPAGYQQTISMSVMGVEFKDSVFVDEIRMWAVDEMDVGVRIDISIGWIRDILLDRDMSPDINITGGQTTGRPDLGRPDLTGRSSEIGTPRRR